MTSHTHSWQRLAALFVLLMFVLSGPAEAMIVAIDMGVNITDTPDPVETGSLLSYNVAVTNSGPDGATDATLEFLVLSGVSSLSTAFPGCTVAGLTVSCLFSKINPIETFNVGITAVVSAIGGSTISAAASVASSGIDNNEANDIDTELTEVVSSVIPIAPAIWTFGTALGLLGWMRRSGAGEPTEDSSA